MRDFSKSPVYLRPAGMTGHIEIYEQIGNSDKGKLTYRELEIS